MIIAALALSGCRKNSSSETSETTATEAVTEVTVYETTATENTTVAEGINPLTGECGYNADVYGKRPVAVMVNNVKPSLPQYGIKEADIIYELPVEAGITRLMAIYADYTKVPDVCSVRSCRYYYPLIALGFDAFYCHWGMDMTVAKETLERTGIDRFDGGGPSGSGIFFRDSERQKTYASEHTGYLDGSALAKKINAAYRTDANEKNYGGGLVFGENTTPIGDVCLKLTLNFSSSYYSTFQYNEETGKYLKFHSGSPHIDSRTGNQLDFKNIFILQTSSSLREDGYLVDVELNGGSGYYVSNGRIVPIIWEKPEEDEPIKLFTANLEPLVLNPGKSYFGIIGYDKKINLTE